MKKARHFSHLDKEGQARMVNVGAKRSTRRMARAEARIEVGPRIAGRLRRRGAVTKGNVLQTARIAGILAAKRTADLIPMCHPISLDSVEVTADLLRSEIVLASCVRCRGVTGVEMEALTAVTVAALTVYDMCKSADKGIVIRNIRLIEKQGGKSDRWRARGAGSVKME